MKVAGLPGAQLAARAVATSAVTLGGLLKHLAFVEDEWFCLRMLGHEDVQPWASAPFDDDPDWEWHSAVDDEPDALARPVRRRLRAQPGCGGRPSATSTACP